MDIYEAIIFCVPAVLKSMGHSHPHTTEAVCLYYTSLGVSIHLHLAEPRMHRMTSFMHASYDCIFRAICAGAAEQICSEESNSTFDSSPVQ